MSYPPGPDSRLLGIDNALRFSSDVLGFSQKLKDRYGDSVSFKVGFNRGFIFFHPDQIKDILVTHWQKLPKIKHHVKVLQQWDGKGLLLSEGKLWQKQHKLIKPAFAYPKLEGYCEIFVSRTLSKISSWEKEIDIDSQMTALALEIICESLFGAEVRDQTPKLKEAVSILNEVAMFEMGLPLIPPRWFPNRYNQRKSWAIKLLDSTIRTFIAKRRQNPGKDLLSSLISSRDEDGQMSIEEIRDEAMVLFLAGHDTVAASLIWTFYNLAKNPEVEKNVLEELDKVLAKRAVTSSDIPRLLYLKQVINESLRLFPPAIGTFAREAREDLVIGGFHVPKKSFLWTFSFITQRDERWFRNPHKFDPERFSPKEEKKIPPFAYFPFGGGPRACIGKDFAICEIMTIVATVLQKTQLKLLNDQIAQPKVGFSLRPAEKIIFSLQRN